MKSEEEIQDEIEKLANLEIKYPELLLGKVSGIVKRRLLWVLE